MTRPAVEYIASNLRRSVQLQNINRQKSTNQVETLAAKGFTLQYRLAIPFYQQPCKMF